jgi:hypothetical protein
VNETRKIERVAPTMNTWNGTRITSQGNDPILVIGPDSTFRRTLAREIQSLPASVQTADSLDQAGNEAHADERAPAIVLVPETEIRAEDFESELAELRIRTGSPHLVPIAFGRAPDDDRRREIRQAGVDLALFGRFGRNALRFQINRALSPWVERIPREELRAPKEWRTRIYSSGKEKAVRCYSLCSGGAYFVTPRPWVVGSDIALELPVGRDRLHLSGHILYTNVGNSSDRNGLPTGMAVAFQPLSEHIQQVIREDVTTTHESLKV